MTERSNETHDDADVVRLQEGIEQTRADMSATMSELETRLSPGEVREKVGTELKQLEDRVRGVVHDQLEEAKTLVHAELAEAKDLLRAEMNEAEEKIRRGLSDARSAVKEDVKDAVISARDAVRAATLGKVEDLATNLGDKMNETRDTLVDTIRNNPVPATVMGVGLVWLLMNRSKAASGRSDGWSGGQYEGPVRRQGGQNNSLGEARSAVSKVAHQVTDAASKGLHQATEAASGAAHGFSQRTLDWGHQAEDAASHLVDQAGGVMHSVSDGAKKGAKRVEQGFQSALEGNPVALGAAAVALGAVVGFALPRTDREDALMGDARDRLLHQAGDVAHDAAASATQFAEQTLESATKQKQEEAPGAPK